MLDRRTLLTATTAAAATAATAAASTLLAAAPAAGALRRGQVLARDLRIPWGLAFLPGGDALITERETGRVHRVDRRGGRVLVGTIDGVDLSEDAGEGGLLGIAVSPTFVTDGLVFVYLTTDADNRIISMRYDGSGLSERQTLVPGIPRARSHNGGRLAFGPDGLLYASTGDSREPSTAQNVSSLAGKILRLNPDGAAAEGNPIAGNRMWSYGHRNVQGLAWDPQGTLWATEFGEKRTDELNRIQRGGNYGWPGTEGRGGPPGTTDPFVTWSPTSTCSPSGVAIARGRAWLGALAGESMYSVVLAGPNRKRIRRHFRGDFGRVRTVEAAPDGSLWITTANGVNDKVIRLVF